MRNSIITKKKYIGGRPVFVKYGSGTLAPIAIKKIGGRIENIPYAKPTTGGSVTAPAEKVTKASQEQVYQELARSFSRM